MNIDSNLIKQIEEKDKIKFLILFKNLLSIFLKNLKKGIILPDDYMIKLGIKKFKDKKTDLSDKTKKILINIYEKEIEKQKELVIDKNSKLYKTTLNQIIKKIKIDIKKIKNPMYIFYTINQITLLCKKTKLNIREINVLITDFFISNGISEIEFKIIIIKNTIDILKNIIKLIKKLEKNKVKVKKTSTKK